MVLGTTIGDNAATVCIAIAGVDQWDGSVVFTVTHWQNKYKPPGADTAYLWACCSETFECAYAQLKKFVVQCTVTVEELNNIVYRCMTYKFTKHNQAIISRAYSTVYLWDTAY